ncbi:tRNA pseudouridine(55) synthase TruB [Proteiniclasticum sp. C24MP]|uniref:tRNA pseudouridine(55) synthase TruB n=1 Tax=Proteiniclasticum sp. C24MP TaxID=3374101 RepID=UPI003754FDBB
MNGVINLYKEKGMTSFAAVAAVRRLSRIKKVGHTGTLDPEAEGVLPVCIGKATKLVEYIMAGNKVYRAGFRLGKISDTLDAFGEVQDTGKTIPGEELVREKLKEFLGESMQLPPMFSALKINGRRLYDLAREGIEVDREKRKIHVFDIELVSFEEDEGEILLSCSKGTYVRSIIDDLGQKLGCGAIMTSLIREGTGAFSMENAVTLETLEKDGYEKHLIQMDAVLSDYKDITISDRFLKLVVNGVKVKDGRLISSIEEGLYRGYSEKGDLLGIVERKEDFLYLKVNLM